GPHRRLDDHRRRVAGAGRRAGRRAVRGTGRRRAAPGRVARGAPVPDGSRGDGRVMDPVALRALVPAVIGVLVRRGADFASAEEAVQEALVRALQVWPEDPPRDPKGWL